MAKRMGAKTIEVKASHVSLISHPDEIIRANPGSRAHSMRASAGIPASPSSSTCPAGRGKQSAEAWFENAASERHQVREQCIPNNAFGEESLARWPIVHIFAGPGKLP
jgi:hypothetical protein